MLTFIAEALEKFQTQLWTTRMPAITITTYYGYPCPTGAQAKTITSEKDMRDVTFTKQKFKLS